MLTPRGPTRLRSDLTHEHHTGRHPISEDLRHQTGAGAGAQLPLQPRTAAHPCQAERGARRVPGTSGDLMPRTVKLWLGPLSAHHHPIGGQGQPLPGQVVLRSRQHALSSHGLHGHVRRQHGRSLRARLLDSRSRAHRPDHTQPIKARRRARSRCKRISSSLSWRAAGSAGIARCSALSASSIRRASDASCTPPHQGVDVSTWGQPALVVEPDRQRGDRKLRHEMRHLSRGVAGDGVGPALHAEPSCARQATG